MRREARLGAATRGALAAGGLALVACSATGASPPAAPAQAAPAAWQVRAAGGLAPIEPGTRELALLDAGECESCHADEHAEWASSRHGLAWRNGIFQREYSAQPRAWCVNCHAPLAAQQEQLATGDARLADQGVSCAACHVRRGTLVSSRRAPGSPHQTVVEPSFSSSAMCADCHQFEFPVLDPVDGSVVRMTAHPMQATVADFRAGPHASAPRGCLTCHGSASGHAFRGGHDPTMLRRAISASWCRTGDAVRVEVGNVGAGHRVPTGDVHRHLLARVWRSTAPESTFEAYFGRRFRPTDDGGKETIWDSTLWPGQRRRFDIAERELRAAAAGVASGHGDGGDDGAPELDAGELAELARQAALAAELDEQEALAEPLNFEVTYVYTQDEVPRRGREPGEPVTAQVAYDRRRFSELPACVELRAGAAQ